MHTEDMNCEDLENLKTSLQDTCDRVLQNVIENSSKCVLLHGHLETDDDGKRQQIISPLPDNGSGSCTSKNFHFHHVFQSSLGCGETEVV